MSTWILLRGLTRETRHWGNFPALLAQSVGQGSPVLPVDLPGNGVYAPLRSPADVAALVGFVRLAVRRCGAHGPYRLLAMSLGGMVAAGWALRYPDEVECLALVNTSMRPYGGVHERLRVRAWLAVARIASGWQAAEAVERRVHALTCNRRDTVAADLSAWCAVRASAPVSRSNAWRQLWAAARFAASGVPRCPVLVLSSQHDRLVHPACSARLAEAWQATHLVHPWAGHDLPHDDPQWICSVLQAWSLARMPVKASA
ncbi:alpha/beta hydrolase [Burkholderia sp. WAC0059]|uniref:alpha/beta fold hydrolase n=1 Tax=Burkholderia sp. WAC0059 TaxID=2066022 RepID=UPI000C7F096E|nr:alpha/beta hydrolase [Burkholderia sp. WAC0059]PLZ04194.1 alpha/beta hydrolase [Burkholderia sp. WAC0059]